MLLPLKAMLGHHQIEHPNEFHGAAVDDVNTLVDERIMALAAMALCN